MAKFAASLCVLLVICSGTQGASMSSVIETGLTTVFKSYIERVQEAITVLLENSENSVTEFNSMVEALVEEWQEDVAVLTKDAVSLKTCISSSTNFEEVDRQLESNANSCIAKSWDRLKSDYTSLETSFEEFSSDSNEIIESVVACLSDTSNELSCLMMLYEEKASEILGDWATLNIDLTTLSSAFTNFPTYVKACGATGTDEAVVSTAEAFYYEVNSCIDSL